MQEQKSKTIQSKNQNRMLNSPEIIQSFRKRLQSIGNISLHLREFENIRKTKVVLFDHKKHKINDYVKQMQRIFTQVIYFYYVAYITKAKFEYFEHLCFDEREMTIFRYYSITKPQKFMQSEVPIESYNFLGNLQRELFYFMPMRYTQNEQEMKEIQTFLQESKQNKSQEQPQSIENKTYINLDAEWTEVLNTISAYLNKFNFEKMEAEEQLKAISQIPESELKNQYRLCMHELEETVMMIKHTVILQILYTGIIPQVKESPKAINALANTISKQQKDLSLIFEGEEQNIGKGFRYSLDNFLSCMNELSVLALTTTRSDSSYRKGPEENLSAFVEFEVPLGYKSTSKRNQQQRLGKQKQKAYDFSGTDCIMESEQQKQQQRGSLKSVSLQNQQRGSSKSSEIDFPYQASSPVSYKLLCNILWSVNMQNRTLGFEIKLSFEKNIAKVYQQEILGIWHKLCEKSVQLMEGEQQKEFDTQFFIENPRWANLMSIQADFQQERHRLRDVLCFKEKLTSSKNGMIVLTLMLHVDRLVLAFTAMREVLHYYTLKSYPLYIEPKDMTFNESYIENLAKDVNKAMLSYQNIYNAVIKEVKLILK